MRPRPDAAENFPAGVKLAGLLYRFNEAAARCRGKQPRDRHAAEQTPQLQ